MAAPAEREHQGIRSMAWDEWIQPDRQFPDFIAQRDQRADKEGSELIFTMPEAREAALEIALELAAFMSKRYPELYQCHPQGSGHSSGGRGIETIECKLRKKQWRLQPGASNQPCDDPMVTALSDHSRSGTGAD